MSSEAPPWRSWYQTMSGSPSALTVSRPSATGTPGASIRVCRPGSSDAASRDSKRRHRTAATTAAAVGCTARRVAAVGRYTDFRPSHPT